MKACCTHGQIATLNTPLFLQGENETLQGVESKQSRLKYASNDNAIRIAQNLHTDLGDQTQSTAVIENLIIDGEGSGANATGIVLEMFATV